MAWISVSVINDTIVGFHQLFSGCSMLFPEFLFTKHTRVTVSLLHGSQPITSHALLSDQRRTLLILQWAERFHTADRMTLRVDSLRADSAACIRMATAPTSLRLALLPPSALQDRFLSTLAVTWKPTMTGVMTDECIHHIQYKIRIYLQKYAQEKKSHQNPSCRPNGGPLLISQLTTFQIWQAFSYFTRGSIFPPR